MWVVGTLGKEPPPLDGEDCQGSSFVAQNVASLQDHKEGGTDPYCVNSPLCIL